MLEHYYSKHVPSSFGHVLQQIMQSVGHQSMNPVPNVGEATSLGSKSPFDLLFMASNGLTSST
jgi:hypothetical protein